MNKKEMYVNAVEAYRKMITDNESTDDSYECNFCEYDFCECEFCECDTNEENKSLFSYCDGEEIVYYPVNNMEKIHPIELIRKNDFLNIVDINLLNSLLNFLDFRLFQHVQEIVFVMSPKDDLYLEEKHGIWVNSDFLGQSNFSSKVAIINVPNILSEAIDIVAIDDCETFHLTVCCEIIKTLIHELIHINSFEDILSNEHKIIDISDDDSDNEVESKVEELTKNIFSDIEFTMNWRIILQSFIFNYLENHEEINRENFI